MAANRFKQLLTLMWKNWLFSVSPLRTAVLDGVSQGSITDRPTPQLRNPVSTLAQLLLPMIFVLMLYLFGFIPSKFQDVPHPQPAPVGHLSKCQVGRVTMCACVRAYMCMALLCGVCA